MKKRILLTLALIATITLAACGKKQDTTQAPTTTSNNNQVVVDGRDRGELDNSLPKIELPDVIINNNNGTTYEANDEQISLGNGDYVETNAGSGASETVEGLKFLTATVNIGYEFLGWYNGDKLVSTQLKYTCKNEDENLTAKFKVKDEFECFEFTSTETECTITGLKDNYPTNLVVPEGVTVIGDGAFKNSKVVNVTLPSTLEALGHSTFSYSKISTLTFKNVPESIGYSTCDSTFIKCALEDIWIADS